MSSLFSKSLSTLSISIMEIFLIRLVRIISFCCLNFLYYHLGRVPQLLLPSPTHISSVHFFFPFAICLSWPLANFSNCTADFLNDLGSLKRERSAEPCRPWKIFYCPGGVRTWAWPEGREILHWVVGREHWVPVRGGDQPTSWSGRQFPAPLVCI